MLFSLIENYAIRTYSGLDGGEKPGSRFSHFIPRKELLVSGDTCSSKEKDLPGVESIDVVRNLVTIFARLGYKIRTSPGRHLRRC